MIGGKDGGQTVIGGNENIRLIDLDRHRDFESSHDVAAAFDAMTTLLGVSRQTGFREGYSAAQQEQLAGLLHAAESYLSRCGMGEQARPIVYAFVEELQRSWQSSPRTDAHERR